jgi:hypothetical protein
MRTSRRNRSDNAQKMPSASYQAFAAISGIEVEESAQPLEV